MVICSQPECQTTAGCVCQFGMTVMDHAKLVRIAELEAALRRCNDAATKAGNDERHTDHERMGFRAMGAIIRKEMTQLGLLK